MSDENISNDDTRKSDPQESTSKPELTTNVNNTNSNEGDGKNICNGGDKKSCLPEVGKEIQSAADYAKAVNQWLWQCYYWQTITAGFPYYLSQSLNQGANLGNEVISTNRQLFPHFQQGNVNRQILGRTFRIPQLWKRLVAEIIDCAILFLLKLVVTFIAIDFFDIIDLDKFDFTTLQEDLLDYKMAFEITSEMVMLEVIHRIVVCFFEAMCLHRGTPTPGGATPGKLFFGLKVVSCSGVRDVGNGLIAVEPGGDIGFGWALLRSFIKNFSLVFFFPICFTLFMLPHNRTAYDVFCNCLVVEEIPRRRQ